MEGDKRCIKPEIARQRLLDRYLLVVILVDFKNSFFG